MCVGLEAKVRAANADADSCNERLDLAQKTIDALKRENAELDAQVKNSNELLVAYQRLHHFTTTRLTRALNCVHELALALAVEPNEHGAQAVALEASGIRDGAQ